MADSNRALANRSSPLSRLGRCKFALSATFTTNAHSTSWGWASLGTYDKKVSIRAEQTRLHRQVWKTVTVALRGERSSGGPYGGDVLGRVLALLAHTPALHRIPAGLQGTPASLQSTVADQYTKSVLLTPSFPHDARRSASPVGQPKNHSLSLHPQSLTGAVA